MSRLMQKISAYAAYHQSRWIKVSHFFGVPMICLSLLMLCQWLTPEVLMQHAVSFAWGAYALLILYYLYLDMRAGIASAIAIFPLVLIAERLAGIHVTLHGASVFMVLFVGGWLIQLLGHYHEGNRPALVDNLAHILIAPLFLVVELLIGVGLMAHLRCK